jgi:hypothetical protein
MDSPGGLLPQSLGASLLFAAGKSPKQVQVWLGHADPAFTLRVYVHLLDDGLCGADFLDPAEWAAPSPRAVASSVSLRAGVGR